VKTRDEIAEALFVASVCDDAGAGGKIMEPRVAFDLADAFVAERERRAAKIENRVGYDAPTPVGLDDQVTPLDTRHAAGECGISSDRVGNPADGS